MDEGEAIAGKASRITVFATIGAMGVTQDLAQECLGSMEGADPEVLAEETLCLVATVTARTLEVALRDNAVLASGLSESMMQMPFAYREYIVGGAMIAQQNPELADSNREVAARLERKLAFYQIHFPAGQFPGQHALQDKMALWMGRISPPGLPELPTERLDKLELVSTLFTHTRLVLAYARQETGNASA